MGAILVLEDVTEKARLEGEVIRMERLATVGQMVITVNHEINNPLAIINTSAQAARLLNWDLDGKTVAKLQMIEAQVKRISEVTERLRTMEEVESNDYIADGPQMIDIHGKARDE
ncbi:MAG: histidine kinase dimerization/phospho-acceptor domain-containing protein [Candidatus Latescibacterota bacterium]